MVRRECLIRQLLHTSPAAVVLLKMRLLMLKCSAPGNPGTQSLLLPASSSILLLFLIESDMKTLLSVLTAIQKPVLYGIGGSPARLFYHCVMGLHSHFGHSLDAELQKLVVFG